MLRSIYFSNRNGLPLFESSNNINRLHTRSSNLYNLSTTPNNQLLIQAQNLATFGQYKKNWNPFNFNCYSQEQTLIIRCCEHFPLFHFKHIIIIVSFIALRCKLQTSWVLSCYQWLQGLCARQYHSTTFLLQLWNPITHLLFCRLEV